MEDLCDTIGSYLIYIIQSDKQTDGILNATLGTNSNAEPNQNGQTQQQNFSLRFNKEKRHV